MKMEYLSQYPASYSYGEILQKIRTRGGVAYCHTGEKRGTLIFSDSDGSIKKLSTGGEYDLEDNKGIGGHELWSFTKDMKQASIFRQIAMNSIFSIHCDYYHYLDEIEVDLFKDLQLKENVWYGKRN